MAHKQRSQMIFACLTLTIALLLVSVAFKDAPLQTTTSAREPAPWPLGVTSEQFRNQVRSQTLEPEAYPVGPPGSSHVGEPRALWDSGLDVPLHRITCQAPAAVRRALEGVSVLSDTSDEDLALDDGNLHFRSTADSFGMFQRWIPGVGLLLVRWSPTRSGWHQNGAPECDVSIREMARVSGQVEHVVVGAELIEVSGCSARTLVGPGEEFQLLIEPQRCALHVEVQADGYVAAGPAVEFVAHAGEDWDVVLQAPDATQFVPMSVDRLDDHEDAAESARDAADSDLARSSPLLQGMFKAAEERHAEAASRGHEALDHSEERRSGSDTGLERPLDFKVRR